MFIEANANRVREPREETPTLPVRSSSRLYLYFLRSLDPKGLAGLTSADQIVVQKGPFRTLLESADTKKADLQERSVRGWRSRGRMARGIGRPDTLQIVELPHLGSEDMHDHIASIDQNPVGVRQALHPNLLQPRLSKFSFDVVGEGRHVTLRAARRDDHGVGYRRFSAEIDLEDVLRLVVIQLGGDLMRQKLGSVRVLSRTAGGQGGAGF